MVDFRSDLSRFDESSDILPSCSNPLMKKVRSGKALGVRDNMAFVGMLSTQLLIDQMVQKSPKLKEQKAESLESRAKESRV